MSFVLKLHVLGMSICSRDVQELDTRELLWEHYSENGLETELGALFGNWTGSLAETRLGV